jgi:predicted Zn-dependent protease
MKKNVIKIILLYLIFCAFQLSLGEEKDSRIQIISAMKEELNRSIEKLKMEDFESPYFISYWIKEEQSVSISGKFGSITSVADRTNRSVYVEVRVGDYKFDNTERKDRGYDFGSFGLIPMSSYTVPLDNDEMAIRNVLWYLTDMKYKEALDNYLKKKGEKIFSVEEEQVDDFSKEDKHIFYGEKKELKLEKEKWIEIIKKISDYIGKINGLYESEMDLSAEKVLSYFVNSEGSEIVDEYVYYAIDISANAKADDGMSLRNFRTYKMTDYNEIPTYEKLKKDTEDMVTELFELKKAEEMKPYTGPAILDPSVTGVIFHEAIGHRLEGERQKREESGQTFKGKVGEKIIPEFLTVIDDPTLDKISGKSLFGHYEFDNEGIPATKVVLVENGVLKDYLLSRTPIKDFSNSNGHGRSDGSPYQGDPVGRMSTIIVKSNREFSYNELKNKLIEECKKQGKPYGFIIKRATGGETYTQRGGMQAFKESPVLVYTVDVNTGGEKLVRGVEIVGTPLASVNKIIASSKELDVFNGYCGAESGIIPVSSVAPWVLTSEVELQKNSDRKSKPPMLPAPFFDK